MSKGEGEMDMSEVQDIIRSILPTVRGNFTESDGYTREERDALIDQEVMKQVSGCETLEQARKLWKAVQAEQLRQGREKQAMERKNGAPRRSRNGRHNGTGGPDEFARSFLAQWDKEREAERGAALASALKQYEAMQEAAKSREPEQFTGTFCSTQKGGQNGDGEQTYRVCGVGVIARMHIHGNITSLEEANRLARNVERAIATVAGVGA